MVAQNTSGPTFFKTDRASLYKDHDPDPSLNPNPSPKHRDIDILRRFREHVVIPRTTECL